MAQKRLRLLSHNIGFCSPISVEVKSCDGVCESLGLSDVLGRIKEFGGFRGNQPTQQNILDCCFSAYEDGQMEAGERACFEVFVKERIQDLGQFEVARRAVIN